MSTAQEQIQRFVRLGVNAPRNLLQAYRYRPYGWGEHSYQMKLWKSEEFKVWRPSGALSVECLLHLHDDPAAPLYVNLGGLITSAMLYSTLGWSVYQRGLNAMMVSLPGHGFSDLPPMEYRSYRQNARIVYEAVDLARRAYGLTGPMRVLGHSHGGGMAEALAGEYGDDISRYYILAGVGGPEWTRVAGTLKRGLRDLRRGRILSEDVADSWQRVSGFISDGYVIIPPPWELAGWQAELIRPFVSSLHGQSATNLYSVLIDTLLDSAEELEGCLDTMGKLEADTIILAGRADGVITHRVIESQAVAAAKPGQPSAPVFRSQTTHAGFLAQAGRNYVADLVAMSDEELARHIPGHMLAA